MIKSTFFTLLISLLFQLSIGAQNKAVENYDREGIYLRNEFWRGNVFVKDGKVRPVGFAYKNLRPEFEKTPSVMPMFNKAQRNLKISLGVSILGLAGTTAGAIIAIKSIDDQGNLINESRYRKGLNLMLGSALISAAINIPLQLRARQHIDDAIWLRNRTLLGE